MLFNNAAAKVTHNFCTMYLLQTSIPSFCSGDYWNGVFQNAIGCAIGSFAAILISIYIYRRQTKENTEAIRKSVQIEERDRLKALSIMIRNAIDPVTIQSENISNLIVGISKYPTVFPLLKMPTWGNLKRIIDTITIEKTGLAYMKHFSGDDSAKEFTTILNAVDYLYFELSRMPAFLERASLNHTERLLKFNEVFDSVDQLVRNYMGSSQDSDEISVRLWAIRYDYIKKRTDVTDLRYCYLNYLIPIIEFMKELLHAGAVSKFIEDLTFEATKGMEFYKSIEIGYDGFAEEIKIVKTEIDKNLIRLRENSAKLLQSEYLK